jgi:hypothetical protein
LPTLCIAVLSLSDPGQVLSASSYLGDCLERFY